MKRSSSISAGARNKKIKWVKQINLKMYAEKLSSALGSVEAIRGSEAPRRPVIDESKSTVQIAIGLPLIVSIATCPRGMLA